MKTLSIIVMLFLSTVVQAGYCECELYAVSPMTASQKVENHVVAQFRGKYYGDFDASSVKECRNDCAHITQTEYDDETLKEKLLPWVNELIEYGLAGYNCTGPTTFKVPVRVRASLGERRLGISRESMVFLHREKSCFI